MGLSTKTACFILLGVCITCFTIHYDFFHLDIRLVPSETYRLMLTKNFNQSQVSKVKPMSTTLILSNLGQYEKGANFSRHKLSQMKRTLSPIKTKVLSRLNPNSLQFQMLTNLSDNEGVHIVLQVVNKDKTPMKGCSFKARQIFNKPKPRLGLCSVEELENATYEFRCARHKAETPCITVTIILQFCNYEAFQHYPRIRMWNRIVLQEDYYSQPSRVHASDPSWTLKPDGSCDHLHLNDEPVHQLSPAATCACMQQFDHVYIIGTSHIRFFADYLMHTCHNRSMVQEALSHGSLESRNIQYHNWGIFSTLHSELYKQLDNLLQANSSIAIWILTGSWDFVQVHYNYAMEIGLDVFNQTLPMLKSRILQSTTRVDIRVIATFPMPDRWYWNNYAIGAFNARLQKITTEHNINYTDAFSMLLPCSNDIPKLPRNNNHYFARHNNRFEGNVGADFFFGVFLKQMCLAQSG